MAVGGTVALVMVTEQTDVQPATILSVTVTVYVPAALFEIEAVVSPELHRYVIVP